MNESQTPMLSAIAAHGNRGHHHPHASEAAASIVCNDGTSLSVLAGNGLYTDPYVLPCHGDLAPNDDEIPPKSAIVAHDYPGPYTAVEVCAGDRGFMKWLLGVDLQVSPQRWLIEVDVLRQYIVAHGGEFNPVSEAESILNRSGSARPAHNQPLSGAELPAQTKNNIDRN